MKKHDLFQGDGTDEIYWNVKNRSEYADVKSYLNELYNEYVGKLDKDFISQFIADCKSCIWELVLTHYFESNNIACAARQANYPDFCVNISGKEIYIEATAVSAGENEPDLIWMPERTDKPQTRRIHKHPIQRRIISVINAKKQQYDKWLKSENIDPCVPFIIAISLSKIMRINYATDPMSIIGSVLGIGDLVVPLSVGDKDGMVEDLDAYYQYEDGVRNHNGALINKNIFLEGGENISAILISKINYSDPVEFFLLKEEKNVNDLMLVHNPTAKNPLQHKLLQVQYEYILDSGEIKKI
jgi:hypothetical protein